MTDSTLWIWGRHPVLEALRGGGVRRVLVAAGRSPSGIIREIATSSAAQGIRVEEVTLAEIERLAGTSQTQGVAAAISPPGEHELRELLSPLHPLGFLLALDQVQDPHNLGALLRTAEAVGVDGVLLPERRSAPLSGAVARTSAGAMHHVRVARAPNLDRALRTARSAGYWIMGLDGAARDTVFDTDLTVPLVLVIGSEGEGLRRLTRERCDVLVRLPMFGQIETLNAAVAGSIAMYEVARQRLTLSAQTEGMGSLRATARLE